MAPMATLAVVTAVERCPSSFLNHLMSPTCLGLLIVCVLAAAGIVFRIRTKGVPGFNSRQWLRRRQPLFLPAVGSFAAEHLCQLSAEIDRLTNDVHIALPPETLRTTPEQAASPEGAAYLDACRTIYSTTQELMRCDVDVLLWAAWLCTEHVEPGASVAWQRSMATTQQTLLGEVASRVKHTRACRVASSPCREFLVLYRRVFDATIAVHGATVGGVHMPDAFVYAELRERAQEKLEEGILDAVLDWKAAKMERENMS
ncbi:hypothetical protein JCM6882_004808 [Rhodosporidiobolus microsporus]